MSLLRLHIPPSWPDAEPDAPLPWCLIGTSGACLDAGSAPLAGASGTKSRSKRSILNWACWHWQ